MLRRTDTNQDYDYADVGERTDYFITDPQSSVCAVVDSTGKLQERLAYSAYGEATHHFPADMDGDGDVDSADTNWFTNLNNLKDIDEAGYNADGDLNRDGLVNTADLIIAFNWNGTAALANGLISDPNGPDNPIGYDGYLFNAETKLYTVRFRHYEPVTGRWMERDPGGYVDGLNPVEYVRGRSPRATDPLGLESCDPCEKGDIRFVDGGMATTRWSSRLDPGEIESVKNAAKLMLGKASTGAQMGYSVITIIITKGDGAVQFAVTLAYLPLTNTISDGLDKLAEQTHNFNLWALVRTQECKCGILGCKWKTTDEDWYKCDNPKMSTTAGPNDLFHDESEITVKVIKQCTKKAREKIEDDYMEENDLFWPLPPAPGLD